MISQKEMDKLAIKRFGKNAFIDNPWLIDVYTELEVWKYLGGCDCVYFVSNKAAVKNKAGKLMKPEIKADGREYVKLRVGGKQKHFSVHRLVATVFIPNHDNKPEVNHEDLNKKNNYAYNLGWMTAKENREHYLKSEKFKKVQERKHICLDELFEQIRQLPKGFLAIDLITAIKV